MRDNPGSSLIPGGKQRGGLSVLRSDSVGKRITISEVPPGVSTKRVAERGILDLNVCRVGKWR